MAPSQASLWRPLAGAAATTSAKERRGYAQYRQYRHQVGRFLKYLRFLLNISVDRTSLLALVWNSYRSGGAGTFSWDAPGVLPERSRASPGRPDWGPKYGRCYMDLWFKDTKTYTFFEFCKDRKGHATLGTLRGVPLAPFGGYRGHHFRQRASRVRPILPISSLSWSFSETFAFFVEYFC